MLAIRPPRNLIDFADYFLDLLINILVCIMSNNSKKNAITFSHKFL